MNQIERLRAVRQLALAGGDLNVARECESALRRLGQSVDCDPVYEPALEVAVPPKPKRTRR